MRRLVSSIPTLLLAGLLGLAACGEGSLGKSGDGKGVIRGIQREPPYPRVVIDHGEIPGVMEAMTMGFDVDDPALLEGLEPGQTVEFHVVYSQGKYKVTAIHAVAADEEPS